MTPHGFLRALSMLLFLAGCVFFIWSFAGLNRYFKVNSDNRLPPAGAFIPGPDEFSFAIMADTGFRDEPMEAVIRDIRRGKAEFILHLGDQVRSLSVNHFEHLLQSLSANLGDTPFYVVPGNHDTTSRRKTTSRYYNRAFGQPYYWFSYGNTLFIALDTSGFDFDKEQREWLEGVLSRLRQSFKNCVLFMHVPPFDPRPNENYAMSAGVEELGSALKGRNITAIIAAHIHEFIKSDFKGTPLYIMPPSGQKMRGDTDMYGYLMCRVEKDGGIRIEKVDVTDKKGRNYLLALLSTDFNGITAALVSFSLLVAAFICLFLSSGRAGSSKAFKIEIE